MKSKYLVFIIMVLLGLGAGYTIFKILNKPTNVSEQPSDNFNRAPGRGFYRLANELGLDEAQKKLFQDFESDYRQQISTLNEEIQSVNQQIIQELSRELPDTVELLSLSRETGLLHEKIKRTTIHHFMNLRSICTPEQAVKLSGVLEQIESGPRRMRNRRGEGHGPGRRGQINQNR